MRNPDEFRAAARELGVSDASLTLILKHLRPAYALSVGDGSAGWLGGYPELPAGMPWDGEQVLVAAVDLAALPEHSLDTGLPGEGRLLLFAEEYMDRFATLDDYDGSTTLPYTLYIPPGTETVAWDSSSGGEFFVLDRRPLQAETVWDLPEDMHLDNFFRDPADMDAEEREMYEEAVALDAAVEEFRSLAGHLAPLDLADSYYVKLCGVAHPQQESVETAVVDRLEERKEVGAIGPYPDAYESGFVTREEQEAAWKPLAEAGQNGLFHEGDGVLYWMVPGVDLALGRFDRTEVVYQC
ncbi:DUF1963 domain-containing protein [Streptomyces sp. CHD11]|uniref:DUF1963 domain-containing protein n=1 Tax=Streptomyces sp. CHD11 TaxID=2741325 RepID=UPI001BFCC996|nr:DUF1963 domain-containing protein [Streptomyces sp. CHD11]MBT3149880.1 DUF1963 domain-containing protein [Streptomyces sp. CHD11]